MKNIFKSKLYVVSFIALLIFSTCTDLEEEPFSDITPNNFYKTENDVILAINAAYDALQNQGYYGRDLRDLVDYPTEMLTNHRWRKSAERELDWIMWHPDNIYLENVWREAYVAVNRCNIIINRVSGINDIDTVIRDRVIGEAKFLRALNYFNIVRLWEDAPLITEAATVVNDVLYPSKSSADEIYTLIISDLQDAINKLPVYTTYSGGDVGRASRGAAKALLGKVYLTMAGFPLQHTERYADAEAILADLIDDNDGYRLMDNYIDVFRVDNQNNDEIVFSIQYTTGGLGEGSTYGDYFNPGRGYYGNWTAWGGATSEPQFLIQFEEGDSRITEGFIVEIDPTIHNPYRKYYYMINDSTIFRYNLRGGNAVSCPYVRKFAEYEGADYQEYPFDFPVIRWADVLLMYAEAINEHVGPTQAAYDAFNQVRERAFKDSSHNVSGLTQEQFREAIIQERKFELFAELHGWFDYVRKGILEREMEELNSSPIQYPTTINVEEKHSVMPIPTRELDVNKNLTQHPLWATGK